MAPGARGSLALVVYLGAALGGTLGATTGAARADEVTRARLVYAVDPAAAPCPSADEFRAAVEARVGHAVFGEPATLTIDVSLRRAGKTFVATVALPDAPGERGATRELRSEVDCAELATAAALVASIAADPAAVLLAPPPPPPAVAPAASRTWRALVGIGVRGAWGLTPDPTVGLALSGVLVDGRAAYGAALEGFLSRDAPFSTGRVAVRPLALALLPCRVGAHWEACAVGRLGLVRGSGTGFDENFVVTKLFAGWGARGAGFIDVGRVRLRASMEAAAVLPRTTFVVGDADAYTTRGVTFTAGLDALFSFQ